MSDAPELNALKAIIDEFDDDVAQQLAEGERADLWTDVEVPVSLLRALLAALREAPVAWRVLAEPNLPVHFALTKADAEHLVNNLLTYRRGCTSARIEPLYASPANEAGAPVAVKKAFFEGFSAGEASGKFGDDTDSDAWDRYALTHPQALTASPVEAPVAVKALGWRKGYCDETVTIQQASNMVWAKTAVEAATPYFGFAPPRDAVTEAMVEAGVRAVATKHYTDRFKADPSSDHVQMNVEANWHIFAGDVRAALTAALQQDAAPGGWRTMDSASKDGTEVLLYGPGVLIADGRSSTYAKARHVGWWGGEFWSTRDPHVNCRAELWQPLAAAPSQEPAR